MFASVIALSISASVVMLGFGIIMPYLPVYAQILGANTGLDIGLLSSAFLITRTFLATPSGSISDRIGRKKMIMAGLFLYTAVSILFGLSQTWIELLIYRSIQGIASAMVWPPSTALLADLTPAGKRGSAMGLYNSISMAGWVIGPGIGATIQWYSKNVLSLSLIDSFRIPFYVSSIFSAVALVLVYVTVKAPQSANPPVRKTSLIKMPFKEINGKFRKTIFAMLFVAVSYGFATSFVDPMLVYFAQHEYNLTADEVTASMGVIFSISGIAMLGIQFYAGRLADRFSKKKLIAIFTTLAQVSSIAMPFSGNVTNIGIMMTLRSSLYSLTSPAYTALQQDLFPKKTRGLLTGLFDTAFGLGSVLGPVVSFIIYDTISHGMPFILSGVLGIITVLILVLVAKEPSLEEMKEIASEVRKNGESD
ncbi:MAG: MFS transporter [Candidatus Methanomethylicus sp.]|nr:MFS transporter [Candidatus Methanomethylicus sp.]